MLKDAANWLKNQTVKHLACDVEYLSKDASPLTVKAVIGRTLFRSENRYGATVRTEARDFLISAEELVKEPQRGDKIRWEGKLFEVLSPNSEPHWRWSDSFMKIRRIHTKEIGEAYE